MAEAGSQWFVPAAKATITDFPMRGRYEFSIVCAPDCGHAPKVGYVLEEIAPGPAEYYLVAFTRNRTVARRL
jgi:hypothetical protein